MTLQQLKYVTTVAQTGTISDAAKIIYFTAESDQSSQGTGKRDGDYHL